MYNFPLLIPFGTGLVHVESAHLQINHLYKAYGQLDSTAMTYALTVDASRCSFPPFPTGVLLGLLESLECFGLRLSTVLVLACWPMLVPPNNTAVSAVRTNYNVSIGSLSTTPNAQSRANATLVLSPP